LSLLHFKGFLVPARTQRNMEQAADAEITLRT